MCRIEDDVRFGIQRPIADMPGCQTILDEDPAAPVHWYPLAYGLIYTLSVSGIRENHEYLS